MKYDMTVMELKNLVQYVEYNSRHFEKPKKSIAALKQATGKDAKTNVMN